METWTRKLPTKSGQVLALNDHVLLIVVFGLLKQPGVLAITAYPKK
jgi:hypothetical protein